MGIFEDGIKMQISTLSMGQRVRVPWGGGAGPSLTMAPPVPGHSGAKPNPPTQILKGQRAGAHAATLT